MLQDSVVRYFAPKVRAADQRVRDEAAELVNAIVDDVAHGALVLWVCWRTAPLFQAEDVLVEDIRDVGRIASGNLQTILRFENSLARRLLGPLSAGRPAVLPEVTSRSEDGRSIYTHRRWFQEQRNSSLESIGYRLRWAEQTRQWRTGGLLREFEITKPRNAMQLIESVRDACDLLSAAHGSGLTLGGLLEDRTMRVNHYVDNTVASLSWSSDTASRLYDRMSKVVYEPLPPTAFTPPGRGVDLGSLSLGLEF